MYYRSIYNFILEWIGLNLISDENKYFSWLKHGFIACSGPKSPGSYT